MHTQQRGAKDGAPSFFLYKACKSCKSRLPCTVFNMQQAQRKGPNLVRARRKACIHNKPLSAHMDKKIMMHPRT